jgi:6-pyruvoyl-tetrahydropterin synthase
MSHLLTLSRHFVADHFHALPGFEEPRHGHNWEVEATVELDLPGESGLAATRLDHHVRELDYTLLNDLPFLAGRNPTAETLAQWFFEGLREDGLNPLRIRVREKINYWAACRRQGS